MALRDVPAVDLRWASPDDLDIDLLNGLRDLVERLATVGAALGEVPGHPWRAVRHSDWTPAWEQEVHVILDRLRKSVNTLEALGAEASTKTSFREGRWSLGELALLDELAEVLLNSPAPPIAILVQPDWDEIHSRIGSWIEHGQRRDVLRNDVFERFSEKILSLDLDTLQTQFEQGCASRWPASWWRLRPVRKTLKSVAKNKKAPAKEELAPVLEQVAALYNEEQSLSSAGDDAPALLGRYWNDDEAEWERLKEVSDWAKRFRSLATRAAGGDFEHAADLRGHWAHLSTEGCDLLKPSGALGRELLAYRAAYNSFIELRDALSTLLDLGIDLAWGGSESTNGLEEAQSTLQGWSERAPQLRDWCAWRRARNEAISANLSPLVEAYERGDFRSVEIKKVFDRSYYHWWHTTVVSRVVTDVQKHEGSISLGLAARRVAAHWGIKRIYKKAENWVSYLLPSAEVLVSTSAEGVLLWPKDSNPNAYDIFRVPGDDPESIRDPEDLPVCEIANAALFILRRHIGAPEEEIVREVSHLFGFRRTGTHVEKRMCEGVALMIKKGLARREGTTVILKER